MINFSLLFVNNLVQAGTNHSLQGNSMSISLSEIFTSNTNTLNNVLSDILVLIEEITLLSNAQDTNIPDFSENETIEQTDASLLLLEAEDNIIETQDAALYDFMDNHSTTLNGPSDLGLVIAANENLGLEPVMPVVCDYGVSDLAICDYGINDDDVIDCDMGDFFLLAI